eukprot:363797-Chlamydomonas_euryale.AAC.12
MGPQTASQLGVGTAHSWTRCGHLVTDFVAHCPAPASLSELKSNHAATCLHPPTVVLDTYSIEGSPAVGHWLGNTVQSHGCGRIASSQLGGGQSHWVGEASRTSADNLLTLRGRCSVASMGVA